MRSAKPKTRIPRLHQPLNINSTGGGLSAKRAGSGVRRLAHHVQKSLRA
jgi:hypothetical protein